MDVLTNPMLADVDCAKPEMVHRRDAKRVPTADAGVSRRQHSNARS
jgi:hypothetical protein